MGLLKGLQKITSLGVLPEDGSDVADRVRLLNLAAFGDALVCFLVAPILVLWVSLPLAGMLLLLGLLQLFVIWINGRRWFRRARIVQVFGSSLAVLGLSLLSGAGSGVHLLLLIPLGLAFVLFPPEERQYQVGAVTFGVLVVIGVSALGFLGHFPEPLDGRAQSLFRALCFVAAFVISITRYRQLQSANQLAVSRLEVAEAWRRSLMEGTLGGVLLLNADGRVEAGLRDGSDHPISFPEGAPIWAQASGAYRARLKAAVEACVAGQPSDLEVPLWGRAQGEVRWMRLRLQSLNREGDAEVLVIVEDVTAARDLAQEARNQSLILMQIREGVLSLSSDGRVWRANPAACALLGLPWERIEDRPIEALLPGVGSLLSALRTQGGDQQRELALPTPQGRLAHLHVSGAPLDRGETEEDGWVLCLVDLSARRRVEEYLQESEARLMALVENLEGPIWSIDRGLRLLAANSAFQRAIEADQGAPLAVGADVLSVLKSPEDKAAWRSRYGRVFTEGRQTFELEVGTPGGRRVMDMALNPIRGAGGRVMGVTGAGRDITAQKQALGKLRASELRFRSLFEETSEAVLLMDDGVVVDANAALIRLFEVEGRDAVLGLTLAELLGGEVQGTLGQGGLLDGLFSGLGDGPGQRFEATLRRGGGEPFVIEARFSRVQSGGGSLVQGLIRDISFQRAREDSLRRARDEAQAAAQAKSRFLANMSHEIRTPMNGVLGMARILGETPLSDVQRDYMGTIVSSAEALLTVINDILDLSKIEAERITLRPQRVELLPLVEEAMAVVAERAYAKGLELTQVLRGPLPTSVEVDPNRLRQILLNLLGNAVKFTEAGYVEVTLEAVGQGGVRFEVADTGVGIPEASLPYIFEPFNQADTSATRRFEGTGLGLTISRRLVEGMGGQIGLRSIEGRGSRFFFSLILPEVGHAPWAPRPLDGVSIALLAGPWRHPQALGQTLEDLGARVLTGALPTAESPIVPDSELARADRILVDLGGGETLEPGALSLEPLPPILVLHPSPTLDPGQWAREGVDFLLKPLRRCRLVARILDEGCDPAARALTQGEAPHASPSSQGGAGTQEGGLREEIAALGPLRVLVTDDNHVNRQVAKAMMVACGCEVTLATGGQEALAILSEASFDLVFMDVQMPDIDGLQVIREIRSREAGSDRHLPVVTLTALAIDGDRERCLAAGADGYVAKPMTPQSLYGEVWRLLGRPNVAEAAGAPAPVLPGETGQRPPPAGAPEALSEVRLAPRPEAPPPAPRATPAAGVASAAAGPRELKGGPVPRAPSQDAALEKAILDSGVLESLMELELATQTPGFVAQLVDSFLDSLPRRVLDIEEAVASRDPQSLLHHCHSLKGTAGNLGALALAESARLLEALCRQGGLPADDRLDALVRGPVEGVKHQAEIAQRHLEEARAELPRAT